MILKTFCSLDVRIYIQLCYIGLLRIYLVIGITKMEHNPTFCVTLRNTATKPFSKLIQAHTNQSYISNIGFSL